jgi:hypothetical protein
MSFILVLKNNFALVGAGLRPAPTDKISDRKKFSRIAISTQIRCWFKDKLRRGPGSITIWAEMAGNQAYPSPDRLDRTLKCSRPKSRIRAWQPHWPLSCRLMSRGNSRDCLCPPNIPTSTLLIQSCSFIQFFYHFSLKKINLMVDNNIT